MKSSLKKKFEITNFYYLHYFFRLKVFQTKEGIYLSQSKYACDLHCFHMEDYKPTPSHFQLAKLVATYITPKLMPLYTIS